MQPIFVIGIVLLLAGFVLVGIEMAIPGFGAPGICGIACLIVGIVCAADDIEQGLAITVIVAVVLAIMLLVFLLWFHKVKSPIILETELGRKECFINPSDLEYLIGREGVALTDLRPMGKCDIEDVEFDVRAQNGYIARDSRVKIIRIQDRVIIVKAL